MKSFLPFDNKVTMLLRDFIKHINFVFCSSFSALCTASKMIMLFKIHHRLIAYFPIKDIPWRKVSVQKGICVSSKWPVQLQIAPNLITFSHFGSFLTFFLLTLQRNKHLILWGLLLTCTCSIRPFDYEASPLQIHTWTDNT